MSRTFTIRTAQVVVALIAVCAALLTSALIPLAGVAHAAGSTPEQRAAAAIAPAVVRLQIDWHAYLRDGSGGFWNDRQPFEWSSTCTGFVVNPNGYLVTAGHCVDEEQARLVMIQMAVEELIAQGRPEADRDALAQQGYASWRSEGESATSKADRTVTVFHAEAADGVPTGRDWVARVLDVQGLDQGDTALLKVETTRLPTVRLAPAEDVQIGTPVLSVGFPASTDAVTDLSLDPTFKDGKVSSKKTRNGGLLPVYEMSAALSRGMSGGPTVDTTGKVIGLNSFLINGESQPFNFLSPSSLISEMLHRNGVDNELGATTRAYLAGLNAYFEGDRATALKRLDEALGFFPSHKQAQEYRTRALDLPKPRPAPERPRKPVEQSQRTTAAPSKPAPEPRRDGAELPLVLFVAGALVVVTVTSTAVVVRRGMA